MDFTNYESDIENIGKESQAIHEQLKENNQSLESYQEVISQLENDAKIVEGLEKNMEAIQDKRTQLEEKRSEIFDRLSEINSSLNDSLQELESDNSAIQELAASGENVSEAQNIIKNKQDKIAQYQKKIFEIMGNLDHQEIDFENTMNTRTEIEILKDMDAKGEIEILKETTDFTDPEFKNNRMPSDSGTIIEKGAEGNIEFIPNNKEAQLKMAEYGKESVEYVNGHPDFKPFVDHESKWGIIHGEVEIAHMVEQRKNPKLEAGRRKKGEAYSLTSELGNFAQGDIEMCKYLISENKVSIPFEKGSEEYNKSFNKLCYEFKNYRENNKLTWHECEDGKTMQLVPSAIHKSCPHTGGVSVQKTLHEYGDITKIYE